MKQVTLNIPEHQLEFFLQLVNKLGFEMTENLDIPEEHKKIVRERIKTANPADLIPWDEARNQLKFKTEQ